MSNQLLQICLCSIYENLCFTLPRDTIDNPMIILGVNHANNRLTRCNGSSLNQSCWNVKRRTGQNLLSGTPSSGLSVICCTKSGVMLSTGDELKTCLFDQSAVGAIKCTLSDLCSLRNTTLVIRNHAWCSEVCSTEHSRSTNLADMSANITDKGGDTVLSNTIPRTICGRLNLLRRNLGIVLGVWSYNISCISGILKFKIGSGNSKKLLREHVNESFYVFLGVSMVSPMPEDYCLFPGIARLSC